MTASQLFGHIHSCFTCPVEPGHVHHGFMVRQLYVFLGYHQLDLVPLLRLRDVKKQHIQPLVCILKNKKSPDKIIHELVGGLTISNHWCTATATCVPRGLVNTNTSPGTALSGLRNVKHGIFMNFCIATK